MIETFQFLGGGGPVYGEGKKGLARECRLYVLIMLNYHRCIYIHIHG